MSNPDNVQLRRKTSHGRTVNFSEAKIYNDDDNNGMELRAKPLSSVSIQASPEQVIEPEPKFWDRFSSIPAPDEDESQSSEWTLFFIRLLKFFFYIFIFCAILFLTLVAKNITTLMASMIRAGQHHTVCNNYTGYNFVPPIDQNFLYQVVHGPTSKERLSWLWALFFAIIAPYGLTFFHSVYRAYFHRSKLPEFATFVVVFINETLAIVGLSILIFVVLPRHDSIKGLMMMNSVCVMPSFLKMLTQESKHNLWYNFPVFGRSIWALLNVVFQVLALLGWTVIGAVENIDNFYMIPIGLVLASFEWWENFMIISEEKPNKRWRVFFKRIQNDLNKSRHVMQIFMSLWKILIVFLVMVMNELIHNKTAAIKNMFINFRELYSDHKVDVFSVAGAHQQFHGYILVDTPLIPIWLLLMHIGFSYLCYILTNFACKVCIQRISFAIPATLTVPVSVAFIYFLTKFSSICHMTSLFGPFQYAFWMINANANHNYSTEAVLNVFLVITWVLALYNQFYNTLHIWTEPNKRLAAKHELFINPMYNAGLLEQSLMMNRRCKKIAEDATLVINEKDRPQWSEEAYIQKNMSIYRRSNYFTGDLKTPNDEEWPEKCHKLGIEEDSIDPRNEPEDEEKVRIYVCATMWHEDRNEMMQMLKAVMRMDFDQGVRRIARINNIDEQSKDYYEMEVNIYFDDAFEQGKSDAEDDRVVNQFVHQLIDVIPEAVTAVYGKRIAIKPPEIVPTPYGGKLIWHLPSGNRLIAHVKDKDLIRHRKRWSQCMYMYYLLGYRLSARSDIERERKEKIARNTFILALDGDINFQPAALHLVIDLMKSNLKLGAACGRIHPIGSGPIVWYQKFEYAIGHWLQKATEHIFGCVLCSPGCFSLFRAQALMDKSIMHKYTTKPTEAIHYVQYDQGEDRWLCTLLLQRGWRIEYCAASDSYTHAPEGFSEFYNQRRRWAPSTMANIMDLLFDSKRTIEINPDITLLYIIYQFILLLGTVTSPGIIFLMLVSAMETVLQINPVICFMSNITIIGVFTFLCLYSKDDKLKTTVAMVISFVYALQMLAVLVGTVIEMITETPLTPNSLFFLSMMMAFVIAACIHPQEFGCVIPLPIYMMLIPSMYLLLTIYSVTNMHIVSWGTREVKSKLSAKELAQQKADEEEDAKKTAEVAKQTSLNRFLHILSTRTSGMLNCACCSLKSDSEDKAVISNLQLEITEIKDLVIQMQHDMQRAIGMQTTPVVITTPPTNSTNRPKLPKKPENLHRLSTPSVSSSSTSSDQKPTDGPLLNRRDPKWITNDNILSRFPRRKLAVKEKAFWVEMIAKYLKPLDENKAEKEKIHNDLIELRNKVVFAFGFINMVLALFVFIMQLHSDVFRLEFPVGKSGKMVRMDPIGFVLVIFFGAILLVQCVGMLIHRLGTLSHLVAYTALTTYLTEGEKRAKKTYMDGVEYVKQVLSDDDDSLDEGAYTSDSLAVRASRAKSVKLDDLFESKMKRFAERQDSLPKIMRRNTIKVLENRNRMTLILRKQAENSPQISGTSLNPNAERN